MDDDEVTDTFIQINLEVPSETVNPERSLTPDEAPKRKQARRSRKISLFSVGDQALARKQRGMELDQKGEYTIVHYDKSRKQMHQETSYGFFDQRSPIPKYKRSVSSLFSESRNSYKSLLEPLEVEERRYDVEPSIPFNKAKVEQVISEEFEAMKHLPAFNQKIVCKGLSNDIKRKVKELGFSRYKYIVMVAMGSDSNQGLNISSRFFWDDKRDDFVSQTMKLQNNFVVANVFAIYLA